MNLLDGRRDDTGYRTGIPTAADNRLHRCKQLRCQHRRGLGFHQGQRRGFNSGLWRGGAADAIAAAAGVGGRGDVNHGHGGNDGRGGVDPYQACFSQYGFERDFGCHWGHHRRSHHRGDDDRGSFHHHRRHRCYHGRRFHHRGGHDWRRGSNNGHRLNHHRSGGNFDDFDDFDDRRDHDHRGFSHHGGRNSSYSNRGHFNHRQDFNHCRNRHDFCSGFSHYSRGCRRGDGLCVVHHNRRHSGRSQGSDRHSHVNGAGGFAVEGDFLPFAGVEAVVVVFYAFTVSTVATPTTATTTTATLVALGFG